MKLRSLLPDFRDLHVYGGGVLMAVGMGCLWRPAGLIVFGAFLLYMGLRK